MTIGIDISQLAYSNTGVANYLGSLVENLLEQDDKNEYILFFSSLRRKLQIKDLPFKNTKNVTLKTFRMPPSLLDTLWNKLHILPIEHFLGDLDIFITSDWTEPPTKKAKKATFLYDLVVYKHPQESAEKIVATQKRKLKWVKKETDMLFCISEATKQDAIDILGFEESRLKVIYPGV